VCETNGLALFEDCAQAHGARVNGRKVGAFGHAGAFSFYPTKNLGTFGDGGAFVTSDGAVAERARSLREYGWRQRYISDEAGLNSRLDELHSAMLRVKLPHLDAQNERRHQIARTYDEMLRGTSYVLPKEVAGTQHVYHQYVIRSDRRDTLREFLAAKGIGTLIHYPVPVHLQPAYKDGIATAPRGLPVTEKVCGEILSLPIHTGLSDDDVAVVGEAVREFDEDT
jgi:dTDP-4-amino-4,6-dideoxygalactose transaminase